VVDTGRVSLTFLLGGARSGKSFRAVRMASEAAATGQHVTFMVTAEALDDEMTERIEKHRAERPPGWSVVEAPRLLLESLASVKQTDFLVIDCLSFWVANLVMDGASTIEEQSVQVAQMLQQRIGSTVVVSNEVGMGLVPEYELGRRFRDVLGRVNASIAAYSDDAFLVMAGRVIRLER
jgi:adenosylcobinamide kinase / adenosylcobinamide-phosphate guanylyltransferase